VQLDLPHLAELDESPDDLHPSAPERLRVPFSKGLFDADCVGPKRTIVNFPMKIERRFLQSLCN
jgi:hypothetical protein